MKKIKESKLANSRALTLVLLALAAVCLGVLSLWFACVDNRTAMFISYFTHPYSISSRWSFWLCCSTL